MTAKELLYRIGQTALYLAAIFALPVSGYVFMWMMR